MKRQCYFIGIGGAGMAPLAKILLERGSRVAGSDLCANEKTAELSRCGAEISIGEDASHVPSSGDWQVIYTSAATEANAELRRARELGYPCMRRGEMLAGISRDYAQVAAVSASHGKTSITAMLSFIAVQSGRKAGYMIGGGVPDFASSAAGDGSLFITEADESDGTHTLLFPTLGIVPNVEDDHAWSLGGSEKLFANFQTFADHCRTLLCFDTPDLRERFARHPDVHFIPKPDGEDFMALNQSMVRAAGRLLGFTGEEIEKGLAAFPGVLRRLTEHYFSPELAVVEDYAHHPTELRSSLAALRKRYPGRFLQIVFQPHRYARLERYFEDFASVLSKADAVLIVPVFAAWSERGTVNSELLAKKIGVKAQAVSCNWKTVAGTAMKCAEDHSPAVIAVIGAGDVEKVLEELPGKGTP